MADLEKFVREIYYALCQMKDPDQLFKMFLVFKMEKGV